MPALAAAIWVLIRRWRAASKPLRRVLAPVYATASASIVLADRRPAVEAVSERVRLRSLWWILLFVCASVPLSFLAGHPAHTASARVGRPARRRSRRGAGAEGGAGRASPRVRRPLASPRLLAAGGERVRGRRRETQFDPRPRQSSADGTGGDARGARRRSSSRCSSTTAALDDQPELVRAVCAAASLALARERTVQALRQSESRYRALLNALPDLMFRLSPDGRYLAVQGRTQRPGGCRPSSSSAAQSTRSCLPTSPDPPRRRARGARDGRGGHRGVRPRGRRRPAPVGGAHRQGRRGSSRHRAGHHRSQGNRNRSSAARAPASSRRGTSSAVAWSATSTTAPSSASSRSPWLSGSPGEAGAGSPRKRERLLGAASEELAQALAELRELARGIHPAVLTDRGLRSGARGACLSARRSPSSSSCRTNGCRRRSRPPLTTSCPRRSRTWPSTPRPPPSQVSIDSSKRCGRGRR